jgi:hypothetical protein
MAEKLGFAIAPKVAAGFSLRYLLRIGILL